MEQLLEFTGNHPFLISAAVILATMIVFTEVRQRSRGFGDVSPADAVKLINAHAVVLDVRSQESYDAGHIVGARHVPLEKLGDEGDKKLTRLKDKPVITYCDNGVTGARAAGTLRKREFSRVFNLRGGLHAWRQEHYPLEGK